MTAFRLETTAAIDAVRQALDLARQGAGDVHMKVGRDVVTDTDLAVEDHLRHALISAFPWPVIGEERGGQRPDGEPYWLVDPICGACNFASGIPLFAVNTALVDNGRVSVSVVGDGSTGDVLVAETGGGAWRLHDGEQARLSATASSLIVDFGGWPHEAAARGHAAGQVAEAIRADRWDVRCFSTTISLAYVATGRIAGCLLYAAPDLVHIAAGTLLVAEAGGVVTDAAGEPWTLRSLSLVCAATVDLHRQLLELVATTPR